MPQTHNVLGPRRGVRHTPSNIILLPSVPGECARPFRTSSDYVGLAQVMIKGVSAHTGQIGVIGV